MYSKEATINFTMRGSLRVPVDQDTVQDDVKLQMFIHKNLVNLIREMDGTFSDVNLKITLIGSELVSLDWVEAYEEYRDPALEDGEEM